jgi:hypothetical protein
MHIIFCPKLSKHPELFNKAFQTETLPAFGQSKPDTTRKYTLSEPVIIQISALLSYGDNLAGNSDKISTRDYNAYHAAIAKVDSVLREQYLKWHPQPKQQIKKP